MTRPRFYTTREAAGYLGMTYEAFKKWVTRHSVPFGRVDHHRRFSASTIDAVKAARAKRGLA